MTNPATDRPKYLIEHLTELRQRLLRCLVLAIVGMVGAFIKSDWLFGALLGPFHRIQQKFPDFAAQVHSLQTLSPIEAFMINMKLATIAGIIFASPFALREIWAFSVPALKANERGAILMVFCLGLFFFGGGIAFGYLVIIPVALQFLVQYNLDYHFIPQWTLQGYFCFVVNFLLVFGFLFELPLVLAALVSIGVATPAFLSQKRKHAIVAIFVLAFFVAPSADPVSQTLVALPLIALYEVGIWLSYLAVRKPS
jgi:sec-independent protein translocase protein TatC